MTGRNVYIKRQSRAISLLLLRAKVKFPKHSNLCLRVYIRVSAGLQSIHRLSKSSQSHTCPKLEWQDSGLLNTSPVINDLIGETWVQGHVLYPLFVSSKALHPTCLKIAMQSIDIISMHHEHDDVFLLTNIFSKLLV